MRHRNEEEENDMTIDELEKDYFATMLRDAEGRYADEHGEDAPATEGFDERAKEDGNRFIAAFHEAFPDSETDGGSLYIARLYDDADLPEAEREWFADDHWFTDATATISESVDGRVMLFFE